jgi:ABC-2 type transport system permease protein
MSTIWTLARKDLLLLLRDKPALFWMLAFPAVFAIFFGSIFGGQGAGQQRRIELIAVEEGLDPAKEAFLARLADRPITLSRAPRDAAIDKVRLGKANAFVDIRRVPSGAFGIFQGEPTEIELGCDPSRVAERAMIEGFLVEAAFGGLRDVFSDRDAAQRAAREARQAAQNDESMPGTQRLVLTTFLGALENFFGTVQFGDPGANGNGTSPMAGPTIRSVDVTRRRDGPPNAYAISFPQAMLWGLMGSAAGFALTFVRERAAGTLVRLWTAPIGRLAILGGKLLACMITSLVVSAVLLTFGVIVFGVTIASPAALLIAAVSATYAFAGVSVLLSTIGRTEQANAGVSWGILCLLAMVGGGMVPQIVMPEWMLHAGSFSPARWTIAGLEGGIWRGHAVGDALVPAGWLVVIGSAALGLGLARFRGIRG